MSNNNGYLKYLTLDTSNMVKPGGAYQTEQALKNAKRIVSSLNPSSKENNSVGYVENLAEAPMRYSSGNVSGNQSEAPTVIPASAAPDAKVATTPLRYGSSGGVSPVSYDVEPEGVVSAAYTGDEKTSFDYLSELEKNNFQDYDRNLKYSEKIKEEAVLAAEEARKNAKIQAEALYRQNASNYGLQGERMLDQGLIGGVYSEHLEGKNMESRALGYNAADAGYLAAIAEAEKIYQDNLFNAEDKLSLANKELLAARKAEYDAIETEKKARFEELFAKVENGDYNANDAAEIFKIYGTLTAAQKDALSAAYSHYLRASAAKAADAIFTMKYNTGGKITRSEVRNWLIDTLDLLPSEAEVVLDSMFDADGNYIYEEGKSGSSNTLSGNGTTSNVGQVQAPTSDVVVEDTDGDGIPDNTVTSYPTVDEYFDSVSKEIKNKYGYEISDSMKNEILNQLKIEDGYVVGLKEGVSEISFTVPSLSAKETYDWVSEALLSDDHNVGPDEGTAYVNKILDKLNEVDSESGKIQDAKIARVVKLMLDENSAEPFLINATSNTDVSKLTESGDNFKISYGGNSYAVKIGDLDNTFKDYVKKQGVREGDIFWYAGRIYIQTEGGSREVKPRTFFGNGQYEKLWKKICGDNLKAAYDDVTSGASGGSGYTENLTGGSSVSYNDFEGEEKKLYNAFDTDKTVYAKVGDGEVKFKYDSDPEDTRARVTSALKGEDGNYNIAVIGGNEYTTSDVTSNAITAKIRQSEYEFGVVYEDKGNYYVVVLMPLKNENAEQKTSPILRKINVKNGQKISNAQSLDSVNKKTTSTASSGGSYTDQLKEKA